MSTARTRLPAAASAATRRMTCDCDTTAFSLLRGSPDSARVGVLDERVELRVIPRVLAISGGNTPRLPPSWPGAVNERPGDCKAADRVRGVGDHQRAWRPRDHDAPGRCCRTHLGGTHPALLRKPRRDVASRLEAMVDLAAAENVEPAFPPARLGPYR
jgi:hypothetical protein